MDVDLNLGGVFSSVDQCEHRKEGVPNSASTLCGEHESQIKPQRVKQQVGPDSAGPGADPEPGWVSESLNRERVMNIYTPISQMPFSDKTPNKKQTFDPCVTTCLTVTSSGSINREIKFKGSTDEQQQNLKVPHHQPDSGHQTALQDIFMQLEENIMRFVKTELKRFQEVLNPDYRDGGLDQSEDEGLGDTAEEQKSSRQSFLKITQHFLRRMKQEELADCLQTRTHAAECQRKLKVYLQKNIQCMFEGITKAGNPNFCNQIYTELYITEGGTSEVNDEHEARQIETASRKPDRPETTIRQEDIFKASPVKDKPIRTVLTKGVAGIGKTVLTQKFTLDWAEDKANQDIQFMFPFTFRKLNLLKEKKFSFEDFQVVFIFDGLDECRLPLDFHNTTILTDVTESTSVDVLLINLIRGKLLPSACLWITTRPVAANQIPFDCVDMVTEVRGFTDPQKEEYFRKRFRDEEKSSMIISHIKTSRSLHIMCHIPVFCWITATVLEDVLKTSEEGELPKTLTEMYIHFLVVQSKVKKVKYDGGAKTNQSWSLESRKLIKSLGKLAFDQLQKGNLIFYESDLKECGINITAASVYSGVFTQIFKEERGLYQDKVFCFIHLNVQEFLAALHVHLTFINSGVDLLEEEQTSSLLSKVRPKSKLKHLHESAVDKALKSPNGHLDLFLRFLLGLSLQTNQSLLQGLLTQTGSSSETNQETVQYIKKKLRKKLSAGKCINLFHCLNELNDRSLVEEIQQSLISGSLSKDELSPSQWSALVFILLSSEEDQDVFDSKKYSVTEEALLRLLPVVKTNKSQHVDRRMEYPKQLKRVDHSTEQVLRFALQKYFCELELDPNTAHRNLKLSDNNRRVTHVRAVQPYPDHPGRFDYWNQLLCKNELTGRCYWEIECRGVIDVAVTYGQIQRRGDSDDCKLGSNDQSWSLNCCEDGYRACHNNFRKDVDLALPSSVSNRVAVYVDCPAGTLSFYRVSSDKLVHLHTFNTTFTEPLYPGFEVWYGSSVSLCSV
ncbi:protein NLRC3-like [Pundamilia nyererei]|uniref:Protein NLRC3-like n=2 Tax=Haplochromini TaxID=319058 RepID=A0A9Y6JCW7_9CICH|nr:PREDICTED: protein NLRC3-like [Pundamilia nyererei]